MKKTITILLIAFSAMTYSQSLSASRILYFSDSQNFNSITKELKQLGFVTRTDSSEGYPIYQFAKKTSRGVERIEMSKNSELFMFTYNPEMSVFKIIKNKVLTSDFKFGYKYKNTNYYENSKMRIGADDANGIISFFKPLK